MVAPPGGVSFDFTLLIHMGVRQALTAGNARQHRIAAFKQQTLLFGFRQGAVFALIHAGVLTLALCFIKDKRGGHGNVKRLHHADHRNNNVLVRQRQCFLGDAGFFLAHQNAGRPRVVDFAKIDGLIRKVGGENLHPAIFQLGYGIANGAMSFDLYPGVTACRRRSHSTHTVSRPNGMDLVHAHRVRGADDRRDVMRLMHLLHADGQIRLAPGEHFADTRITLWIHNASFCFG